MKIRRLRTMVFGPILLLLPMMCMHLGGGHHSGDHHSSQYHPSSFHESVSKGMVEQGFIQIENGDSEER